MKVYSHEHFTAMWTALKPMLLDKSFVSDLAYDRDAALATIHKVGDANNTRLTKKQALLLIKHMLLIVKLYQGGYLNSRMKPTGKPCGIPQSTLSTLGEPPLAVFAEIEIK